MAKEQEKSIWKSKTFWINFLLLIAGIITALVNELQTGAIITIPAIVNLILRKMTTQGVRLK